MPQPESTASRLLVQVTDAELEVFHADAVSPGSTVVCAAHPADPFNEGTAQLLSDIAEANIVCINPRGIGRSSPASLCSLEETVDDLEAVRLRLNLSPWVFWGMSGGGWLAQIYAHRHPEGLQGVIIESACRCFRERLADPQCVLSPFFPAWRAALVEAGVLAENPPSGALAARDLEWIEVKSVGQVLRKRYGSAVLVSPGALAKQMEDAMPFFLKFDSRSWLRDLSVPALIIAGTDDPLVPLSHVRAIHEAMPGSTFMAVQRGKHVPSLGKSPEIYNVIRDFLDTNVEPPPGVAPG